MRAHRSPIATLAAILALGLLPGSADAAAATTPNACFLSYDLPSIVYRDVGVTLDATADGPATVVPGDAISQSAGTLAVEFPTALVRDGYGAGILQAGDNQVAAQVWVALDSANVAEEPRVVGPLTVDATVNVQVGDPADGSPYQSHTVAYTPPPIPALDWTANGGDVRLAQGRPGAIPQELPLGPSGAPRDVVGSLAMRFVFNGGATVYADCQPGSATGSPFAGQGPEVAPVAPTPYATFTGPRTHSCLSEAGQPTREIELATFGATASGSATTYDPGRPYTLTGARLTGEVPEAVIDTIPAGDGQLRLWVTLGGSGTTEGTQTVSVDTTYTPGSALALDVPLPDTVWTPAGTTEPLGFTVAPQTPGPLDGGYLPYGGVTLRFGTATTPQTLDCARGRVAVTGAPPYSNAGREGSAGRYTVTPNLDNPPLATVASTQQPPPPAPDDPGDPPPADPGSPPGTGPSPSPSPAPGPAPDPSPTPDRPRGTTALGAVAGKRLTARGRRTAVALRCPRSAAGCEGRLTVRTARKLGKRKRAVGAAIRYELDGGDRARLRLRLSARVRRALARRPLRVVVTLAGGGERTTRRVTLRARG